jgi:shikimate dehydrogenase
VANPQQSRFFITKRTLVVRRRQKLQEAGMLKTLDGETRLFAILGDPIAQVKSPGGITQAMIRRGANAVLVPMHVRPDDFDAAMRAARGIQNLEGLIMTVPHKIPVTAYVDTLTDRAKFLGACNILRRTVPGGGWHADATDGYGFVGGLQAAGFDPAGKRALLVGAGGAGSAIALALVEAGVADLAIHDALPGRRDKLIGRLNALAMSRGQGTSVRIGGTDPAGFDLAVNATPMGMQPSDPLPMDAGRLDAAAFAADVITAPARSAFLEAAVARGCRTQTGLGMFSAQVEFIADFLLGVDR